MKKTIEYSKRKLNDMIIEQYENNDVYDYCQDGKTEFELEFTDYDIAGTGKYRFLVIYDPFYKKVYDEKDPKIFMAYKIENGEETEQVKVKLKTDNYNPTRLSLSDTLIDITNKQLKRDEENLKAARDIEETNNLLNEKMR